MQWSRPDCLCGWRHLSCVAWLPLAHIEKTLEGCLNDNVSACSRRGMEWWSQALISRMKRSVLRIDGWRGLGYSPWACGNYCIQLTHRNDTIVSIHHQSYPQIPTHKQAYQRARADPQTHSHIHTCYTHTRTHGPDPVPTSDKPHLPERGFHWSILCLFPV